ncbi:hypothetical protein [Actinacidiphila glaucinigra]|uniref:hypothetical protein n=1 Tax=Actinacidiphila glaucinigra TaxID=235986 RepID=UPI003D909D82
MSADHVMCACEAAMSYGASRWRSAQVAPAAAIRRRTGRPKAELVLTDDERATLTRWTRRWTSSQALALRCRIVLECASGASNQDVLHGWM